MAFDGADWDNADFGRPNLYHSKFPLIGNALGNSLKAAYVCARRSAMILIDQVSAYDFRNPTADTNWPLMSRTSLTAIAGGYRHLPSQMTHIVAEILFALHSGPDAESHHRVLVTDGTNTDTGTEIITAGTSFPGIYDVWLDRSVLPAFSHFDQRILQRVTVEVALSTVTAGAVRRIQVDAYAVRTTDSAAMPYIRQHVIAWGEIRD